MLAREKFTAKEWRRAFAKYSKLGYPSDDTPEEDGNQLEIIGEKQISKDDSSPSKLEDSSANGLKHSSFTEI